eukprot:NODE_3547_length_879_cov_63.212766_g3525_i0.p1 GENE.NODE_3547_length_879_cov_63.212766_g3525_i0~~NODE_3547_length_879_cov_63.212766_g3525_i0.p1  ORF type:complete len:234 (-),score=41.38 NODE_3547_length_879_cov_63.212766_g3525_i0:87-788(-)
MSGRAVVLLNKLAARNSQLQKYTADSKHSTSTAPEVRGRVNRILTEVRNVRKELDPLVDCIPELKDKYQRECQLQAELAEFWQSTALSPALLPTTPNRVDSKARVLQQTPLKTLPAGPATTQLRAEPTLDTNALAVERECQLEKLRDIQEIEEGTTELRQIADELHICVIDQQPQLTAAESNIKSATQHVADGVTNLKGATAASKSSRKCMCWLLATLLGVAMLLAVIVVATM